jgi:hypothetical protein
LPIFSVVVSVLVDQGYDMPEKPPESVAKTASNILGSTIATVQTAWSQKPFDDHELMEMIDECLLESSTAAKMPVAPSILLEIRKIGDSLVPLVNDRYEDLVINTAAQHKWIAVGPSGHKFHGSLVLKRKEQTKEILYKILETLIYARRNFFEAKTRDQALEIIRTRPFQQKEVVERHGIDKGVIARHFNDKPILTPHGLFIIIIENHTLWVWSEFNGYAS